MFPKIGVPQNGWFTIEKYRKFYWNGWFGGTPITETSISGQTFFHSQTSTVQNISRRDSLILKSLWLRWPIPFLSFTPLKINMEHNHGGLVQIIFLSKWVICCLFHVNLSGCSLFEFYLVLAWCNLGPRDRTPKCPIPLGVVHLSDWDSMCFKIHSCKKASLSSWVPANKFQIHAPVLVFV